MNAEETATLARVIAYASSLIPFFIAMLLWFFPMTVSRSILKPDLDKVIEPVSPGNTLTVILLAMGLYFFYNAAVDASHWLTILFMNARSAQYAQDFFHISPEHKAQMVAIALELILSTVLILKAKTVSQKMLKLAR
ncbi:hypothetical protein [Hahella ganghwensis]|uniref:hypothetical protein n=1 Tax=Hahella ganghwensis TaxID=286420 RepID=UPI0003A31411|nr:hypothetical protein [Hahella ganghwensis]